MNKSKQKTKRFLSLDKLGKRIAHAQKSFAKQRQERAEKSFQRSMMQMFA